MLHPIHLPCEINSLRLPLYHRFMRDTSQSSQRCNIAKLCNVAFLPLLRHMPHTQPFIPLRGRRDPAFFQNCAISCLWHRLIRSWPILRWHWRELGFTLFANHWLHDDIHNGPTLLSVYLCVDPPSLRPLRLTPLRELCLHAQRNLYPLCVLICLISSHNSDLCPVCFRSASFSEIYW